MDRWLRNISLLWKIGGAILLSLMACLCFVWFSFGRAVDEVSEELWHVVEKMAQDKVNADLDAAYAIYRDMIRDIHLDVAAIARSTDLHFHVAANQDSLGTAMKELLSSSSDRFSFLCVLDKDQRILGQLQVDCRREKRPITVVSTANKRAMPRDELFRRAWAGTSVVGTMLLSGPVMKELQLDDFGNIVTSKAGENKRAPSSSEDRGLVVASIVRTVIEDEPYLIFGGRLLNNDVAFVDGLKQVLYGSLAGEDASAAGTATIFLRNLRISTNVIDEEGKRAVGTVVSLPVERAVLRDGKVYRAQATVVGRRFFTAYRPLVDVLGDRAGILYVGVPEDTYRAPQRVVAQGLRRRLLSGFTHAAIAGLVCALLIGYIGARFLTQPLISLRKGTEALAEGNLRVAVDVDGEDEIGSLAAAFRRMTANLRSLTAQVSAAALGVSASARQIGQTMQDHGSTTAQQSAAVSETTATLEELAASSRQIADNALQVVKAATKTLESASRGVDVSRETLTRMSEIQQADSEDIARIHDLSAKLARIDEIMTLINAIADQTRLIAFNAAIEAAAAGEAGKRFGVVSAEIRRLAATTRDRSKEIRDYLSEIQSAAASLVESREATSGKVTAGVEATEHVSESLEEIRDDSAMVLTSSKQISLATQQQRTATEQTLSAVREINEGINLLAAGAQETETEIDKLGDLSERLRDNVEQFEI